MRRIVPVLTAVAATLALAAPASAGTARSHKINATVDGSVVRPGSTVVSAFLLRDNALGTGAGRLNVRSSGNQNANTSTTGTATAYLPGGTLRFRMTLRFGTPANGQIPVSGTGEATGGTGKFRGVTGDLELDGSQNTQTLVFKTKVTGRLRW